AVFFFSSRRRHTRSKRDWSSDVCSSDLETEEIKKFQSLFPLKRLENLTLKEYDARGSKDSLTYMIEHGTNEIFDGSLGSNKNKLFYQLKDNKYDCIVSLKNRFHSETSE